MDKPEKWVEAYPHGTKEGDEEQKFFIVLTRKPQWEFRSIDSLVRETKLSRQRVEEIIDKYYKKGMIFQNPSRDDQWGYWERVPYMLKGKRLSIVEKDQEERIKKISH
jgi:hypothetical protein